MDKSKQVFYNGKLGVWVTVGGIKLFIEDGYTLEEAMYNNGFFNKVIQETKKRKRKYIQLRPTEYAIVQSEINKYYGKNETRKFLCKWIGDYVYFFENFGFDNYGIMLKRKIVIGNKARAIKKRIEDE